MPGSPLGLVPTGRSVPTATHRADDRRPSGGAAPMQPCRGASLPRTTDRGPGLHPKGPCAAASAHRPSTFPSVLACRGMQAMAWEAGSWGPGCPHFLGHWPFRRGWGRSHSVPSWAGPITPSLGTQGTGLVQSPSLESLTSLKTVFFVCFQTRLPSGGCARAPGTMAPSATAVASPRFCMSVPLPPALPGGLPDSLPSEWALGIQFLLRTFSFL